MEEEHKSTREGIENEGGNKRIVGYLGAREEKNEGGWRYEREREREGRRARTMIADFARGGEKTEAD